MIWNFHYPHLFLEMNFMFNVSMYYGLDVFWFAHCPYLGMCINILSIKLLYMQRKGS